jgi:hypothetical protein
MRNRRQTLIVEPRFNPNLKKEITSETKLAPGITVAKFLGAYSDRTSFDHITNSPERLEIARQLVVQAQAMRSVVDCGLFDDVRLIVSEGLYRIKEDETLYDDENIYNKTVGNLVYYQVIDSKGQIDYERTYDVAAYLSDYALFDELILDYDEYNPDGTLSAQIGLLVKNVGEKFTKTFEFTLKTVYNNHLQTRGELTELKPRKRIV